MSTLPKPNKGILHNWGGVFVGIILAGGIVFATTTQQTLGWVIVVLGLLGEAVILTLRYGNRGKRKETTPLVTAVLENWHVTVTNNSSVLLYIEWAWAVNEKGAKVYHNDGERRDRL